ncbi:MAG: helix-turn-helix transcriptional regulator [Rhodospirillaceae bacterium]|nr:helix-turn-helix transcriptional regulator [Rhodospirillaceae bacterium]
MDGGAFAEAAFSWLRALFEFDKAAIITSFPDRPGYQDAWFHGYADPSAVLASWSAVAHLDPFSARLLTAPHVAQRQDFDAVEIAAETYADLRAHLERFAIHYSACIAIPAADGAYATVVILTRGLPSSRFDDAALAMLEAVAPHVAEAAAVCRAQTLVRHPGIAVDSLPVAIADDSGRLVQTTPAFGRLFWEGQARPQSTQLPDQILAAFRAGTPQPLAGGSYRLHALRDGAGWLLRIRRASPLDRLTERERAVIDLYIAGVDRKSIARRLGVAPSTVKNHIANSFVKLNVATRAELVSAVRAADA